MAKTTADYVELGRHDAQIAPSPQLLGYVRGNTSWQAKAYFSGFDAEMERLSAAMKRRADLLKDSPLAKRVAQEQAHWPEAAREHARILCVEATNCLNTPRMTRLMKSVDRLYKRHGRGTYTADTFPISTQPHPDGPITVGQLLRGQ